MSECSNAAMQQCSVPLPAGMDVRVANAFLFSRVRAIFSSVVEAGLISVAVLALILQYGHRVSPDH